MIPNPKDDASEAILMSENVEEDSHDNEEDEDGSQELAEEQVEAFIRSEQLAASEGNNVDIDSKYTPQIGMEFKDRDDAHHFFSFYGFLARFEVVVAHVTRTTSKKRNNEVYKQEMKCHRYGKPLKNKEDDVIEDTLVVEVENTDKEKRKTNVQVKTNCKCVMVVKEIAGIWRVIRLDLDHNHKLSPQNRNQLFSGRKYMTYMKKGMIRTLNDNNIPTRKMIAILSYLRGGLTTLPHKTKDVQNIRTKINRELLRFNLHMWSIIDIKGSKKKEIATQYLSEEFKRIEKHLDMLLAEADRGASSSVTIESGKAISLEESSRNLLEEIVVLRDPDRI
uniref:FAR1 domain-containing protein n=1 Tax=Setaria viridis TaxID=4556 RepID=A0A4V6DBB0_SETVI|nr:hypothetical protein SEVIR_2G232300v2 [Setaria viridis]